MVGTGSVAGFGRLRRLREVLNCNILKVIR
jgi:hypothetical protein